jgi:pilus assembly protein CpaE
MIRLAILKQSGPPGAAVPLIADDTGIFDIVLEDSSTKPSTTLTRDVSLAAPEAILLDVSAWPGTKDLLAQLKKSSKNAAFIGFSPGCTPEDVAAMEAAGIGAFLVAPFSAQQLDAATRKSLHQVRPLSHPDILAFLPSKAGSGCSTVVLNTAAVLANELGKRTLLIEGDRRSGVLSVLLDVESGGLPAILAESSKLTTGGWRQHLTTIGKLDLLLANPLKPGPQPTWATYFQILDFVKTQYDYILVDLPELLNPATVELAQASRLMFIVCEPELPSLKLVEIRRGELEAAGVVPDKIAVLGNRWEGRRLTKDGLEKTQVPMYAALPNDYLQVKNAAIESRLVSKDSAFGRACEELARRVCGMQAPPEGRVGSLLRRFGKN